MSTKKQKRIPIKIIRSPNKGFEAENIEVMIYLHNKIIRIFKGLIFKCKKKFKIFNFLC